MNATRPIRLAFLGDMGIRGASHAMYDYADYAERLLHVRRPLILYRQGGQIVEDTLARYKARFGEANVVELPALPRYALRDDPLDRALLRGRVTHLHRLIGAWNGLAPTALPGVRVLMHVVYDGWARLQKAQPRSMGQHGGQWRVPSDLIVARVSSSVPDGSADCNSMPVVPHIVRPLGDGDSPWTLDGPNMRASLGISPGATVFCRHGGRNSFNRLTTREGLIVAARRYPSIYFILMNTNPCHAVPAPPAYHQCIPPLPNVILLNATADALKPAFIRTCDAMIHGRENGEMFGLALAEFSVMRRPIFTCGPKAPHLNARAHLDMLGEKAFVHSGRSVDELVQQIGSFDRRRAAALGEYWNAYSTYAPEPVMRAFECVFLQRSSGSGGRCRTAPASSASTMLQDDPCESCQPYSSPRANGCVKPR